MSTRSQHRAPVVVALAAGGLLLTACGGSSGSSSSSAVKATPSSGASAAMTTTVVHNGPLGKYLTDDHGRSVYIFSADTSATSTCHGGCSQVWPAVMSGGTQLVFHGRPLYYYANDSAPGATNGEGINNFGGTWTLVRPDGSPIPASTPKASPTSSGGGSSQGWG